MSQNEKTETWKCQCGAENSGAFCSACGRPKDSNQTIPPNMQEQAFAYNQQMMQMQLRQQEAEEEQARKTREYTNQLNEYTAKLNAVPFQQFKKWIGSWVVLILSIMVTLIAILQAVSIYQNLSVNILNLIVSLVDLLMSVLAAIGLWRIYAEAHKKKEIYNVGGIKMLKGVITFYEVIVGIILSLAIGIIVFVFFLGKSCSDSASNSTDADVSSVTNTFTGIIIGIIIGLIVLFVFCVVIFNALKKITDGAASTGMNKYVSSDSYIFGTVILFILGGVNLIVAIFTYFGSAVMGSIYSELNSALSQYNLNLSTSSSLVPMISRFASAFAYIAGGIATVQFNHLSEKVREVKMSIPKPQRPN